MPRVEVITSVQRHRSWPTTERIRLVEETMQPGTSVSYAAGRAGVAPSSSKPRPYACVTAVKRHARRHGAGASWPSAPAAITPYGGAKSYLVTREEFESD
jgi:hypothetical protein